ncbi:MAG: 3-isopropylmalate dehydratase small subunit [Anaerolineales bacterium]
MPQFTTLTSRVVPLPIANIDTDQIIPASFLKITDKSGLAEALFYSWRYHADGRPVEHFILNQPRARGAQILLAGDNFGCGSSREHAPWALLAWGFRAVISSSFADIFRNNALKNGLLPVTVTPETLQTLFALLEHRPDAEFTIDLANQTLSFPGGQVHFPIDPFSKTCLLEGLDELGYLLRFLPQIEQFEKASAK